MSGKQPETHTWNKSIGGGWHMHMGWEKHAYLDESTWIHANEFEG